MSLVKRTTLNIWKFIHSNECPTQPNFIRSIVVSSKIFVVASGKGFHFSLKEHLYWVFVLRHLMCVIVLSILSLKVALHIYATMCVWYL